ncbi:MAG: glycosyltransferase family 39 protein [Candidatus Hydrogenedentes bacterium]|nr:glycosyltransferase family 39 protein [Candidatus Hydrogenedentota bacterium]
MARATADGAGRRFPRRREIAGLAALFVLSLVLRLYKLDASFWNDEVLMQKGASLPLMEIISHRFNFLYYLLAHICLNWADNEVMLRLPSVVAGVLGVLALYGLTRQIVGARNGIAVPLLASVLLSISAYHLERSQEARFYALVILASILMTWTLWRALESRKWTAWAAFCLSANLGVASQLTVLPYVGVLLAAAGFRVAIGPGAGTARRRLIGLATVALVGALSVVPLCVSGIAQGKSPDALISGAEESADDASIAQPPGGPDASYRLTPLMYARYLASYLPGTSAGVRIFLTALMLLGSASLCKRTPTVAFLLIVQVLVVPLPFLFLHMEHWFNARYFCSLMPFVPLLTAMGVQAAADLFRRLLSHLHEQGPLIGLLPRVLLGLLAGAASLISCKDAADHFRDFPEHDWKSMGKQVASLLEPGDTLAFARSPIVHRGRTTAVREKGYDSRSNVLEFYIRRYLRDTDSGDREKLFDTLRFTAAGSPDQIRAITNQSGSHRVLFISRSEESLSKPVRRLLSGLPSSRTVYVKGLTLRLVEVRNAP